jgi:hypothetical protein
MTKRQQGRIVSTRWESMPVVTPSEQTARTRRRKGEEASGRPAVHRCGV